MQNMQQIIKPTKPNLPSLPNQTCQTKHTKPNLLSQTCQTKPTKPNIPNQTCQNEQTNLDLFLLISSICEHWICNVWSDCVMTCERGCLIFQFFDLLKAVNAWICSAFGNVSYVCTEQLELWILS